MYQFMFIFLSYKISFWKCQIIFHNSKFIYLFLYCWYFFYSHMESYFFYGIIWVGFLKMGMLTVRFPCGSLSCFISDVLARTWMPNIYLCFCEVFSVMLYFVCWLFIFRGAVSHDSFQMFLQEKECQISASMFLS